MIGRRFFPIDIFENGAVVVSKKANWTRGAFYAIHSTEDWTVWGTRGLAEADRTHMSENLASLVFSRDVVVPFDPACPSMAETRLGASGHLFGWNGVFEATDGYVKKDSTMGAGVRWSRPNLDPICFEINGLPKSIVPELSGFAAAIARAPIDEDLTILNDSKSALQRLQGMQTQDFPVFQHRRAERRLLEHSVCMLNRRAAAGHANSLCEGEGALRKAPQYLHGSLRV